MERPETRYVDVGGAEVAYQVAGQGPPDVVHVAGWGHIDLAWEHPGWAAFVERLASFSRLILFDRRGMGASDAVPDNAMPTWEEWADDVGAVLDAESLDAKEALPLIQVPTLVLHTKNNPPYSTGDGFLASFDGPARAIHCALYMAEATKQLGIELHVGLHTGECEVRGDDLGGLAVHIAARVGSVAGPGEVLVSSTVKDLVAGSKIDFVDRGDHRLKGVRGTWRLYRPVP